MRISVVVPTYNGERFVGRTLESVSAQTTTDWELIVVDDGSVDGTAEVGLAHAARDPRVRVVRQENQGIAEARNRGLADASSDSEFVIFLDHDDVWAKDALAILVQQLDANPTWVAVSALSRVVDEQDWPVSPGYLESWGRKRWGITDRRLVLWPLQAPTTFGVLAYANCIHTPGHVLIRRCALEQTGPFDPSVAPCDDWDLWLRLSQRGDIGFVDRVLLNWRHHAGNASNQTERMAGQIACIRRRLLHSTTLSREQREIALVSNGLWGRRLRSEATRQAKASLSQRQLQSALWHLGRSASSYVRCLCRRSPA